MLIKMREKRCQPSPAQPWGTPVVPLQGQKIQQNDWQEKHTTPFKLEELDVTLSGSRVGVFADCLCCF